jgi:hypothetical protein
MSLTRPRLSRGRINHYPRDFVARVSDRRDGVAGRLGQRKVNSFPAHLVITGASFPELRSRRCGCRGGGDLTRSRDCGFVLYITYCAQ